MMQSDQEDQEQEPFNQGNILEQTGDGGQLEEPQEEPTHHVRSILEVKFPTA